MTAIEIEYCEPCGLRERAFETADAVLDAVGGVDELRLSPAAVGGLRVAADGTVVFDSTERAYDRKALLGAVIRRVGAGD